MSLDQYLLTDEQMRRFISHGYLVLNTDFSDDFHASLNKRIAKVMQTEGNPGNNFLPRLPQTREVFKHPVIKGALTSVLGENYIMHPHRHCHYSEPGREVQQWHKDSYWGYQKVRNHHNWWAMIFYYPQDVDEEMGPSAIMPGTQYYQKRAHDESETEEHVLGKAGTFALIHYDLWHKGTANVGTRNRAMMKFQFVRMAAPTGPAWNHDGRDWAIMNGDGPPNPHESIWRHQWQWHKGEGVHGANGKAANSADAGTVAELVKTLQGDDVPTRVQAADKLGLMGADAGDAIPALREAMTDRSEPVAVNAAYALSAMGDAGREALFDALRTTSKSATRNAGYGLSATSSDVVGSLIESLRHESELTRGYAAFALSERGSDAQEAIPALADAMDDSSEWVRRNVTEALGTIEAEADLVVPALIGGMKDADEQVRFTTALSLTRLGPAAEAAVPVLGEALDDDNRYVRANAVDALLRIGSSDAQQLAVDYLRGARWCSTTTPDNTF